MARKGKIKIAIEPIEEEIRPVRSRKYVYFVLIVCEDENTEPAYFKQFEDLFEDLLPEETVYVKRVGTGRNSLGVVNAAIAERTRIYEENNHREIDETWVVFDKVIANSEEKHRFYALKEPRDSPLLIVPAHHIVLEV